MFNLQKIRQWIQDKEKKKKGESAGGAYPLTEII
jgi:hypothetical protein